MKMIRVLWWTVILISFIWIVISIVSYVNYSLINKYDVIQAKIFFGETAEILKKEEEVSGLLKQYVILSLTNLFVIIVGVITLRKIR